MRALLMLGACSGTFGGKDDTAGTDTDTDTDTGTTDAHGLPDLTLGLETGGCEEVSETAVPGAASYFMGTYWRSGTDWEGEEQWMLFANQAWQQTGEDDCVIVWDAIASEIDPGTCAACDLGLAVAATIDLSRTTCPEGLYKDEENFSESYGVQLDDDGTTRWYFGKSGNLFGAGFHEGDAMNYITDKACAWF